MKVKLHITTDSLKALTWGDMIALEEACESGLYNRSMRDMIARFLVNGSGQPVEPRAALEHLSALSMVEVGEVVSQFIAKLEEITARPPNGTPSDAPSSPVEGVPGGTSSSS